MDKKNEVVYFELNNFKSWNVIRQMAFARIVIASIFGDLLCHKQFIIGLNMIKVCGLFRKIQYEYWGCESKLLLRVSLTNNKNIEYFYYKSLK